jgi:hypothetical protein
VASHDEWAGSGSVDPAFAELFRAEDGPVVPAPSSLAPAAAPQPAPAAAPDEPGPADVSGASVDTGRLFRSQGVVGSSAAVLALSSDHGGRLRTLSRTDVPPPSDAAPVHAPMPSTSGLNDDEGSSESEPIEPAPDRREPRQRRERASGGPGLRAGAVYLLVIGVTVLVAFINALIANGNVGWPTGLALLLVTVYCALKVRREDDLVAIITPPIAFFLAAITAAQLFLGSAQHSLLNRAVVAFFTLANNWIWIIGATVVAVVIVLVRRRR